MNINISDLKDYAHKLMFDMDDLEYETLLKEFDVVLKQMDIISKFDNIGYLPSIFDDDVEEYDMY